MCVYSIDLPLPHLLFLIICVTFYFLLSSHIFLILYYLVSLMLILILLTAFILTFVTSLLVFYFAQVVDTPTHFSPNGRSTLIDLVFVSNLHSFSNCSVILQLSNSDHLGLMVTLKHQYVAPISIPCCRVWRYKHADFDRANELLCDMDLNPYDIATDELEAIQIYFPGCNGAVQTEVCAPGEKQLTLAYQRDYTVDQEEKLSLQES